MATILSESKGADALHPLAQGLAAQESFAAAVAALLAGKEATFDGAWGSSCALLAAALARQAPGPVVLICPDAKSMEALAGDIPLFSSQLPQVFPPLESAGGAGELIEECYGERLRTLKGLLEGSVSLLVGCIQSLLQPVPPKTLIVENTRRISMGGRLSEEGFCRWLSENGFSSTSAVQLPGEFALRGGILDVYAPDWESPVRIELFDDEVESLRTFDPATQRSREKLAEVEISVLPPASQSEDRHLAEYLPENSWVVWIEPQQLQEEARQYDQRAAALIKLLPFDDVRRSLAPFASATAAALAEGTIGAACHLGVESVQRFSGEYGKVVGEIDKLGGNDHLYLIVETEAEAKRLQEMLAGSAVALADRLHFVTGRLTQGFRLPAQLAVLISGGEMFHRAEVVRPTRRRQGKAIDSFLDLREGDLVVHLGHGIGRYRGLKKLAKEDRIEEHLAVEFAGGTTIFVPATRIDLVQKYVGGTKTRPKLAKLGGVSWVRQKQAATDAVVDMASEMLELQALRASRGGISFTTNSEWQREFDASFPYQETVDQIAALEAISDDMYTPRPMDRLLCGDVGYGKTEVAMRAAFKAVDNGYQVAVLVPTTILAEQHYHTFSRRMAEFPFDIARLSRFCSTAERKEILKGLQAGRVDIVIGTHRLASRDVHFHNLGLVIIDEEQRFGVQVKEKLKTLRASVDILTMSATPIPRTLHMSLVGVRDISNLESPPEDRIAVETKVTRFDEELIRTAVLRELSRGGQTYFVHNRVNDIELLAQKLQRIVPEASLRIGHGQMNENDLEEVMVDFVAGKFDLLLATTIVESGLDIPNANTIFIDEADRYGLADLHQLRGRVGRYKHRAHCYLLTDPQKRLTPNASRRLKAIEEFSEMGAGFAISMRDLEIRGAGNLLGTQQSGHIAAVGYEFYCQLLENAVRNLKQLPPKRTLDVDVQLPGQAYFPESYIFDLRMKIDLYRRVARICSPQEIAELREELCDRFGDPPPEVDRLLELSQLKIDASLWQVHTICLEEKFLVLKYADRRRMEQLAKLRGKVVRIVDDQSVYIPLEEAFGSPHATWEKAKTILLPP